MDQRTLFRLGGVCVMFSIFFISAACTRMADHVFTHRGYVNMGVVEGIGPGADHENYLLTADDTMIFRFDTMNEVQNKLYAPDRRETAMDGREIWTYENERVNIIFEDGHVCGWEHFEP